MLDKNNFLYKLAQENFDFNISKEDIHNVLDIYDKYNSVNPWIVPLAVSLPLHYKLHRRAKKLKKNINMLKAASIKLSSNFDPFVYGAIRGLDNVLFDAIPDSLYEEDFGTSALNQALNYVTGNATENITKSSVAGLTSSLFDISLYDALTNTSNKLKNNLENEKMKKKVIKSIQAKPIVDSITPNKILNNNTENLKTKNV